jgi:hypothetical protein
MCRRQVRQDALDFVLGGLCDLGNSDVPDRLSPYSAATKLAQASIRECR